MTPVQTDSSHPAAAPQRLVSKLEGMSDQKLLHRFTADGDASAFEVLVRRHGPMVLGVCRRMLRDRHAADDAFQATFLVLVRRAASIRQAELLGNWLYGVAYRTAMRARIQAATRHDHEMRVPIMSENDVLSEVERREFQEALDEELNRLPKNYRDPFILCYMQEKTQAQAALLLGCPVGSISGRLAIARERVRSRLSRRGLVFSASLFPALVIQHCARCEVPGELMAASVRSAMVGWNHAGAEAGATASQLAQCVLREMNLEASRKIGLAAVSALVVCLLVSQPIMHAVQSSTVSDAPFARHVNSTDSQRPMTSGGNPVHASLSQPGAAPHVVEVSANRSLNSEDSRSRPCRGR